MEDELSDDMGVKVPLASERMLKRPFRLKERFHIRDASSTDSQRGPVNHATIRE